MKKIILITIVSCVVTMVTAQQTKRFIFATSIGTGIDMSEPAVIPVTWEIIGYYAINEHFSTGIGTGLSIYEKVLIPLFGNVKFAITKLRKLTPYTECSVGYSFAPDENANGGFYLNPSIGVQYSIGGNKKLSFALGYELQKLERSKIQVQPLFTAAFTEKLSHNSISIKIGLLF